jgi:hypothetical protein
VLVTMHGTIMVFFVAMPILLGAFGNFLIPLMIGARDMVFPRLNMLSVWVFGLASLVLLASFFVPGGAASAGWTGYPPLSDRVDYTGVTWGLNLWLLAHALEFASFLMGGVNYLTTAIVLRAPGMTLFRLPLVIYINNTYFVVAHFHYTLFSAVFFGGFAGLYFWFPKMTGRMFSEGLGKLHFFAARPGGVSFEAANPRHAHEWRLFERVKLPAGKILIPGVLESKTNYIEHPELVAQRIARYAKLVGRENVIAGTDCGYGTWVGQAAVDPGVVWAKLGSLAEGAALASREFWR